MCTLKKQHDFFNRHKSEIMQDYENKVIVINNDLDIKAFNNVEEAYAFGVSSCGLGNFFVQECTKDTVGVSVISPIIQEYA